MDQPGSEAVGIGAEAAVNNCELFCQRRAMETDFEGVMCGTPRNKSLLR